MQKSYPSVKTWCAEKFDDLNSFDLSDDISAVFPDEVCRGFEAEYRFDLAGDVKETFACFKHELYKAALLMALGVLDEIAHDVEFVTLLSKFAFAKQKGTLADLSEHPIYSNAYLDDFLGVRTKLTKLKAEECTIDKYQAAAAFRAVMPFVVYHALFAEELSKKRDAKTKEWWEMRKLEIAEETKAEKEKQRKYIDEKIGKLQPISARLKNTNGIVELYLLGLENACQKLDHASEEFALYADLLTSFGADDEDLRQLKSVFPDCPTELIELLGYIDGTSYRKYADREIYVPMLGSDVDDYTCPYCLQSDVCCQGVS